MPLAHIVRISGFTVLQAGCSMLVALAVGIPAAFFTARRTFAGRRILCSLASVPLCVPALLIALGYISVWGRAGICNRLLQQAFDLHEPPVTFLYSFAGIVTAQGFYNFPLVMATVADRWATLGNGEADAARLLGAGEWRVFRTITVYQLLPAIVSAGMLVFLYCFFSFMIVLLFGAVGTTTLEVEIYQSARGTVDFSRTATLALTETTLACLFVALYSSLEQKAARTRGISFAAGRIRTPLRGTGERCLFTLMAVLVAAFFLAPLAGIAANAVSSARSPLTADTLRRTIALRGFARALGTTILTASATGLLCAAVAFCYAIVLRTADRTGKHLLLRVIPLLPMAVSSVVLGVALTLLVRRGTILLLIAAQVSLTWPLAFRQIYASLAALPQETIDAARLLSAKRRHLLFRIYLHSAWRGILSAAGFCFAVSAGDTTLPLVLALPRTDTLALFTYRLASSYRSHEACAAGLLLGVLCCACFGAATLLKKDHAKGALT